MKILITSGATREPLDGIRFITNQSTGHTGAYLADYFVKQGDDVYYLHGTGSIIPTQKVTLAEFSSFANLDEMLKNQLENNVFDAIIHCAAVSDFSVDFIEVDGLKYNVGDFQKINSESDVQIKLKKNYKIIERVKRYSKAKKILVVAFKLTNKFDSIERVRAIYKLSLNPQIDFVVHNDLSEIHGENHPTQIYKGESILVNGLTKADLAKNLREVLQCAL